MKIEAEDSSFLDLTCVYAPECQLSCRYCISKHLPSPNNWPFDVKEVRWKPLVELIISLLSPKLIQVILTGREPTLRKSLTQDVIHIIESTQGKVRVSIQTNFALPLHALQSIFLPLRTYLPFIRLAPTFHPSMYFSDLEKGISSFINKCNSLRELIDIPKVIQDPTVDLNTLKSGMRILSLTFPHFERAYIEETFLTPQGEDENKVKFKVDGKLIDVKEFSLLKTKGSVCDINKTSIIVNPHMYIDDTCCGHKPDSPVTHLNDLKGVEKYLTGTHYCKYERCFFASLRSRA